MNLGYYIPAIATLSVLFTQACLVADKAPDHPTPCSEPWYEHVELMVPTGDGMGHGPDPGSDEWQSVVEFRLGIQANADIPSRSSPGWCEFIDKRI